MSTKPPRVQQPAACGREAWSAPKLTKLHTAAAELGPNGLRSEGEFAFAS